MVDVTSIIGTLFGGASGAGEILAILARDSQRGTTSVSHLARETRLSVTKTHRAVGRLIEMGLAVDEYRGASRHIALNDASPFHKPLLDMLYLAYGVRPRTSRRPIDSGYGMQRLGLQLPYELVRYIPDELQPASSRGDNLFDHDDYDGPQAVWARQWERQLLSLAAQASHVEDLLQEAYRSWKDERDRDLVHQVLHLGNAAGYGARVLSHAAERSRFRSRGAHHIGRKEWRLAQAAVRAEGELCRATIAELERAVDLAKRRRRTLLHIAELEAHLSRASGPREEGEDPVTEAAGRLAQQRRRELIEARAALTSIEEQMRGTYRTGGLGVDLDEVDTAGERLIVAALREAVQVADALAEEMERLLSEMAGPATLEAPM